MSFQPYEFLTCDYELLTLDLELVTLNYESVRYIHHYFKSGMRHKIFQLGLLIITTHTHNIKISCNLFIIIFMQFFRLGTFTNCPSVPDHISMTIVTNYNHQSSSVIGQSHFSCRRRRTCLMERLFYTFVGKLLIEIF